MNSVSTWVSVRIVRGSSTLFLFSLTVAIWTLALKGLKNKKIKVRGGIKLTGKKAVLFGWFWLVIAVILTTLSTKALYLLIINPYWYDS